MNKKYSLLRQVISVILAAILFLQIPFNEVHAEDSGRDFLHPESITYTDGGFEITYRENALWQGHVNAQVTITNNTQSDRSMWELCMDYDGNIEAIYNAEIVSYENGKLIIKAKSYNSTIYSKTSVSFGFTASGDKDVPRMPSSAGLIKKDVTVPGYSYCYTMCASGNITVNAGTADVAGDIYADRFSSSSGRLKIRGVLATSSGTALATSDGRGMQDISETADGVTPPSMPDEVLKNEIKKSGIKQNIQGIREDVIRAGRIVYSKGDIDVSAAEFKFDGILAAPEGTVRIDAGRVSIDGIIIARNIIINATEVTISGTAEDSELLKNFTKDEQKEALEDSEIDESMTYSVGTANIKQTINMSCSNGHTEGSITFGMSQSAESISSTGTIYSYNGHAYSLRNEPLCWKDADTACHNIGGHLVTIHSQDENSVVRGLIETNGGCTYTAIGISDFGVPQQWRWTDGTAADYVNWHRGEPNYGSPLQPYGYMYQDGTWDDGFASNNTPYVCEWDDTGSAMAHIGCAVLVKFRVADVSYITGGMPDGWNMEKSADGSVVFYRIIGPDTEYTIPVSFDAGKYNTAVVNDTAAYSAGQDNDGIASCGMAGVYLDNGILKTSNESPAKVDSDIMSELGKASGYPVFDMRLGMSSYRQGEEVILLCSSESRENLDITMDDVHVQTGDDKEILLGTPEAGWHEVTAVNRTGAGTGFARKIRFMVNGTAQTIPLVPEEKIFFSGKDALFIYNGDGKLLSCRCDTAESYIADDGMKMTVKTPCEGSHRITVTEQKADGSTVTSDIYCSVFAMLYSKPQSESGYDDAGDDGNKGSRKDDQDVTIVPGKDTHATEPGNNSKTSIRVTECFFHVYNDIAYDFYTGTRKTPAMTGEFGSGNDTDQAELLVSMLNGYGYKSHLIRGKVRISAETAADFTGLDNISEITDALALTFDNVTVLKDISGVVKAYSFEHTWAGIEDGEKLIQADPSLTGTCSMQECVEHDGTNETVITKAQRTEYQDCIPALKFDTEEIYGSYENIEQSGIEEDTVSVSLNGICVTKSIKELYNNPLILDYSRTENETYVPVLLYGTGNTAQEYIMCAGNMGDELAGDMNELIITVHSYGHDYTSIKCVESGGIYAVVSDQGNENVYELQRAADRCNERYGSVTADSLYQSENAGLLLDYMGKSYLAQTGALSQLAARYANVRVNTIPEVVITGCIRDADGTYRMYTDVAAGNCATAGDSNARYQYMLATGMASSALEGMVIKEFCGTEGISTMSLFSLAEAEGKKLVRITHDNIDEITGSLSISESTAADIRKITADGTKDIIIPESSIETCGWSGIGYIILDMSTGSGEYKISGGYSGGLLAGIDAAHLLAAFAFGLDVTLYALDTVLIYNTLMTAAWMMSPLAIAVSAGLILYMTCRAVEMTAAYEEYLEGGSEELDEIFADTAANGFTSLVMAQYYGELISTARWWTESSERQDRGNRYPDSGIKTGEIFGDSEGKLKDTTENRQLLEKLANSEDNYCGTDRYGNEWYAKTNADGSQTWVKVKNGEIKAGGTNKSETAWNYDTGMQEAGRSEGGSKAIPDKARDIAKQVKANNGAPPKGYKGGRTYKNTPLEDGAQKLPEGVNYKEYDINLYVKGQNRGAERIVIGDDGSVWYTDDHYYTFVQIE